MSIPQNLTTVTDLDTIIPEIWSKRLYEVARAKMFWEKFTGPEGSDMPVIRKVELLNNPGDTIHISRVNPPTGTARTGDQVLSGFEMQLITNEIVLTPDWYRQGYKTSKRTAKRINNDFRQVAMLNLSRWMQETMDASKWTVARTTAAVGFDSTTIQRLYGGDATSIDTIDSSDTMSVELIRKGAALLRNSNRRGVMVSEFPGKDYFVMACNPFQIYDLKQDTEYTSNMENAMERGSTNPLFSGMVANIDGVIIHDTTFCTTVDNASSPAIATAVAVMLGSEALAHGMEKDVTWNEQIDDYEFFHGVGVGASWEDKVMTPEAIVQIATACLPSNSTLR